MIELTRLGETTYKDEEGNVYKDIDYTPLGETPETLYATSPRKDIDGEPDFPVTDFVITNPPSEREIKEAKYRHQYMMLSHLKMDCDYYFCCGNRKSRLWADTMEEHLAEMRRIYDSIPEDIKPEWITMADIDNYERMYNEKK